MPRIAISYRREDSLVITGRIFDRLVAHYGRDAVFRDIDNIPLGVDFRTHVNRTIDSSDIVLAIVGPRWIGPRANQKRLANPADPVRVEIEAAVRKGAPLIPVLVLGATMPRADQLPEPLKDFAYRNATQVDAGPDFDMHIARLIRALDGMLQGSGAPAETPVPANHPSPEPRPIPHTIPAASPLGQTEPVSVAAPAPRRSTRRLGAAGFALAGALIMAAIVLLWPGIKEQWWPGSTATPAIEQAPQPSAAEEQRRQADADRQRQAEADRKAEAERQRQADAERQRQVELERQKNKDLERQERADAERQRQADAERQRQAELERQRAELAEREQQAYASAKDNLTALRTYVTICRVCAFAGEARAEIARLETAEQEERSYNAARGNLPALRAYLNSCKLCTFVTPARSEVQRLEGAAQEEQAYHAAQGNLTALKAYVAGCKICAFEGVARPEIARLENAAQDEQTFNSARDNLFALRSYVNSCKVCTYLGAARDEIARLEAAQPKQRAGAMMLCGRSVDYLVDAAGVADSLRGFLGVWTGAAWGSRICGSLIVESADRDGTARLKYIYGPMPGAEFPWKVQRQTGTIQSGQLNFQDEDGGKFVFTLTGQNQLRGNFTSRGGGRLEAVLTREPSSIP